MRTSRAPLFVLFLVTACGSTAEQLRRSYVTMISVQSSVPALRDTVDGCASDLAFTNPFDQEVRVVVTYRAFDADGRELPGFRVGSVVPAKQHVVLAGDSIPGLACETVARLELHRLEVHTTH